MYFLSVRNSKKNAIFCGKNLEKKEEKMWEKCHRQWHKIKFYVKHAHLGLLPPAWLAKSAAAELERFERAPAELRAAIENRVHYYNALSQPFFLPETAPRVCHFPRQKPSSYYYDLKALLRYFPLEQRFSAQFGDVTTIPELPQFVKSRPITKNNENAVLLKLDSVRHFYLYPDRLPFRAKKSQLVWRGAAHQNHRIRFLEHFHQHPLCDVGCIHARSAAKPYHREFMSVKRQLQYRYILSLEGNDVATNLKWIMASNSLCLMPAPRYETWMMEGRLQAGVHYVQLRDDFADLEEQILFFERYPEAAEAIIKNAQQWMSQFARPETELWTALLVMKKYFSLLEPQ